MKIIAITNLFPNPANPTWGTFNYQLFSELSKKTEVHLFAPIQIGHWLKNYKTLQSTTKYNGITVTYLCQWNIPKLSRHYNGHILYSVLKNNKKFINTVQSSDLIFSTWCYPDGWAAGKLAHDFCKKHLMKIHGSDINLFTSYPKLKLKVKESLLRPNFITTVSDDLKKTITELGVNEDRITTIYSGINRDLFYPRPQHDCRREIGLSGKDKIILFVGSLKLSKGIGDLIEAFYQLQKELPASNMVKLYVIGQGRDREHLCNKVKELEIESKVTFVGSVPHSDIPRYIGASDIVSLPSHNEGVPNILLESQACGRFVVATEVGGIPEIVLPDQNGTLVPAGDPEALSAALGEVLKRDFTQSRIDTSEKIGTWSDNAEKILTIMNRIIKSNGDNR